MTAPTYHYDCPSRRGTARYHVWYAVTPGQLVWQCDCPARRPCWHIDLCQRLFRAGLQGRGPSCPFSVDPIPQEYAA